MKRLGRTLIAGTLALSVVTGASAQQGVGIANPTTTIPNFDIQSVGPILNELGVTWQAGKADNGQTYITASVAGQVNFIMAPAACRGDNGSDCVGLNMVALYEGNANPQTVSAFNYRYAFASAGIDPSGTAYLSRYEISDYGTPRGNLATSIMVFANQAVSFGSELDTARRTVSLEGHADDLAAASLNRQVRADVLGVHEQPTHPIEYHQLGLEDGAAYVREFINDKSAPRNKITNVTSK